MTRSTSPLPASSIPQLAIKALARQGQYGTVTSIAHEYDVRRERVYAIRDRTKSALEAEFMPVDADERGAFTLELTDQDVVRTVIGMRVMTPSSIRDEVAMLPLIYGFGWSFGKIQGILKEAGERVTRCYDC